jgi:hypothetical protein
MSISENNKEQEIIFNAKALTSTWLDVYTKISDLMLVFDGKSTNCTIPCDTTSCGMILGKILAENKGHYNHVALIAKIGGCDKVLGELEIK